MYIELGNRRPHQCVTGENGEHRHELLDLEGAPAVTYLHIPDGTDAAGIPLYGYHGDADIGQLARHLLTAPDRISRLPGHEALIVLAHQDGVITHHHGENAPSWVRSDDQVFADLIARFYDCPVLDPGDTSFEDTHWTHSGRPGIVPGAAVDLQGNITQNGRDMWARAMGGGQVGATGQASAATSTTLTTGSTYTTNQWAGATVYASVSATQMVFGNVSGNTNASNASVLTVDQWYTVGTPGGAAGPTPSATATFVIIQGNSPSWFMGLTANSSSPASPSTATSLASEITTASGGLIRKICPYAHTASANTYTLTPVFTANGSDSLPVTVAKIGVFDSMVVGDTTSTMMFETLLPTSATLSASGDQLTVTETITGT